jgi:hypothetical protein
MKKIVLTLFVLLNLSLAQEQFEQWVFNVGGSLSYSNSKTTYPDRSSLEYTKTEQSTLTPSFSIFVAKQFSIGVTWSYLFYKSRYYYVSNGNQTSVGAMTKQEEYGINARYYVPIQGHAIFCGASFIYHEGLDYLIGRSYLGEVGIDLFVIKNLAVEPSFQYSHSPKQGSETNSTLFSLGFRYFFF